MSWAKKWQNFNPSSTNLTRKPLFSWLVTTAKTTTAARAGKMWNSKTPLIFCYHTQVFYYEKHRRTIGILRLSEAKRGD